MTRVLFVDDEPNVLAGLRRMLRSMDAGWDLRFCGSGEEALAALSREPHDVLVTDIRMPGMDGATLLEEVSRLYPHVIRIVLSGQASQESILRAVGPAHQYLSKPCDGEAIKARLQQTVGLRRALSNPSLEALVAQLHDLPSVPSVYVELIEVVRSDHASVQQIGQVIERDAAMTAKMLQLVNSAYFGVHGRITTAAQAVQLLGLDLVRTLMLSAHVFSRLNEAAMRRFHLTTMWQHSLKVSRFTKSIAAIERVSHSVASEAMTAGILHDVGRIILASCLADRYAQLLQEAIADKRSLVEAEQEVLGCTHAEVGAYLLGLWGLPDPIRLAVAFHHRPSEAGVAELGPLALVHAADATARRIPEPVDAGGILDTAFFQSLGLASRCDVWRELYEREYGEGKADGSSQPTVPVRPRVGQGRRSPADYGTGIQRPAPGQLRLRLVRPFAKRTAEKPDGER